MIDELPDIDDLAMFLYPYVKHESEDDHEAAEYARWVARDLLEWLKSGCVLCSWSR